MEIKDELKHEYTKREALKELKTSSLVFGWVSVSKEDGAYIQLSKGAITRVIKNYDDSVIINLQIRMTDNGFKHCYVN